MHNVVIIGGMAAGCKAAARLSRLSSSYYVTIVERGAFISLGTCGLPLYAAGEVDSLAELSKTPYGAIRDVKYFSDVKGVRVLTKTEVEGIDRRRSEVMCRDIDKGERFVLSYDSLIIATGAEAVRPKFPYPSSPLVSPFHTPSDAEIFRKAAEKGKIGKAVVIGGGFVGCELIEALTSLWGIDTAMVEKEDTVLPGTLDQEISAYLQNAIRSDKLNLILSTAVNRIDINESGQPVVLLENGEQIESDYVFYCLGVQPDSKLAREANIGTGRSGGIIVNEQMRTNVHNIWAAGDCVETLNLVTGTSQCVSFGSLSNRMGRVAADSIAGRKSSFKGTVGAISLKLFTNIVCAAGLTEKKAQELGYRTGSVIGCWTDRPDYHPEAKLLLGKLVYEKRGLRLLGLQLIGEGEATRYLDVFAELLAQNKSVDDLLDLEHGYTPAHSSPISPLNSLGFMAINQETDRVKNFNPIHVSSFEGTIIDVRELSEVGSFPFPEESVHIPVSEIRSRLKDFAADEPLLFICEKGPRAYEAARFFHDHGHKNVSYLGGGNLLYTAVSRFSTHGNERAKVGTNVL